jgi:transketolase
VIGFGAPTKAGTERTHGSPLGSEEIAGARKALGWDEPAFAIPADVLAAWRTAGVRSRPTRLAWLQRLQELAPERRAEFQRRIKGELREADLTGAVRAVKQRLAAEPKDMATRAASEVALAALWQVIPELIGGSADLTGSNNTRPKGMPVLSATDYSGRFIHYGVREHAMAAVMNGMAVHGGIIPYSGTFLVFSDYARPALRLAALMGLRVIHVMTHDSIGLGEDGPTHQPIEHLAALRAIPNLLVFRPCDAVETIECWELALQARDRPSILALTRQSVPQIRKSYEDENRCAVGAYEISPADRAADISIFASGSEVAIAVDAQERLARIGIAARVVSVPCFELFFAAPEHVRAAIIGDAPKVAVEAAVRQGWDAIIGSDGAFVGMTSFGASAPYKELYHHFGITAEKVVKAALSKLGSRHRG